MKTVDIEMNKKTHKLTVGDFINKDYKKEWDAFVPGWTDREGNPIRYDHGSFTADDGNDFAVYDGAQNYMGRVNKATGEVSYNGDKSDYKEGFIKYAKIEICK